MEIIMAKTFKNFCSYGCGKEACYQLKNGKWCCSKVWQQCSGFRQKISNLNIGCKNPNYGKKRSIETKHKQSRALKGRTYKDLHGSVKARKLRKKLSKIKKGKFVSEETRQRQSNALKGRSYEDLFGIEKSDQLKRMRSFAKKGTNHHMYLTIKRITKKYPFFSQIEEIRYNPDKPNEKEIQVHCKNHECENSKEKGGWFIPTRTQLYERIRCLELHGTDNSYFYCCQECKDICPLYASKGGTTYQKALALYTQEEYQIFREFVLERDEYICQYCGEKADHVHHERPQKIEPFFSLDPDLAWSVCKKCHYKYGHRDECSTGNLANKVC